MKNTVTIACVWVRGHVPFSVDYVIRLRSMVERNLPDRDFHFVCLTDRPKKLPNDMDTFLVQNHPRLKGWWPKVNLWRRNLFAGRVLYLDLDVLILNSLDPIIDYPARFALIPDGAPHFNGQGNAKVVKRYNSSVMTWDAGVAETLFTTWQPNVATRLWGDQDWIGEQFPEEATMPLEWFPRISEITLPISTTAKVVLCKRPKNTLAAIQWPWVRDIWK